ncbi:hypothetical protein V8B97DRAFT_2026407 [Scleroderma yunnanense]
MPSSIEIKITPSMVVDVVYPWLEKYANKEVSLSLVEQRIKLKLATVGVHIEVSPTGWQEVQAAWQAAKTSLPPLVEDVRAWQFIYAWVSGLMNLQTFDAMEVVFGSSCVYMEWMDIFEPLIEVWQNNEDGLKTYILFKQIMTDQNLSLPPLPSQECYLLVHNLLPLGQDDDHFVWGSKSLKK